MSIYLAQSVSDNATHPLFSQRDIRGCAPGKLSAMNVFGKALMPQTAYSGYVQNIDIFIASTARQMRLSTRLAGALVDPYGDRPLLPLVYPALAFTLKSKLPADREQAWINKLIKWGPEKKKVQQNTIYIFHKPDIEFFKRVSNIADMGGNRSQHYVMPKTFQEIILLQRLVTEFLAVNTYPAYSGEETIGGGIGMIGDQLFKRAIKSMIKDIERTAEPVRSSKRRKMEGTDEVVEPEEKEVMEAIVDQVLTLNVHPADRVEQAKPSPIPASFNFGSPSEVPGGLPGRVFPYFPGMISSDNVFLKTAVRSLFLRCLGDSREEWEKRYSRMRNNMDDLANTPIGMVFTHLLQGIQLALETHTRMFVVFQTGEYAGFVLLGSQWRIHLPSGEWVGPETADKLHKTVAEMSTHGLALSRICEALSDMDLTGDGMSVREVVNPDSVKTARRLVEEINKRKIVTKEDREKIGDWTSQLAFTRGYLPVSVESLTWAIEMLTVKASEPVDTEIPLFITSDLSRLKNRTFLILGAFGPDAPSFINASGNLYNIPPTSQEHDPNEEPSATGKGKLLPAIYVASKGLVVACSDMQRVISEKVIMMDFGERAARHRCRKFEAKDRDALYGVLKTCIGRKKDVAVVDTDDVVAGKKRKGRDDEEPGKEYDAFSAFDDLF